MNPLRRHLLAALLASAIATPALAQDEPKGWIVASLIQEGAIASVGIQLKEREATGLFSTDLLYMRPLLWGTNDFDEERRKGKVVVLPLKPGTYFVNDVQMEDVATNRNFRLRAASRAPIEVKAGEVTYLGEMVGTGTLGKPFLGFRAIEKAYILVADQQARDMPLAGEKAPEIKGKPVKSLAPFQPADMGRIFYRTRLPDVE
ncbi:MAG TPA: hypothetical protein PLD37_01465 [Usitatibacteraceae bacterium]|nr:hypothetical protein [Usitatibacteraceae bacterium]